MVDFSWSCLNSFSGKYFVFQLDYFSNGSVNQLHDSHHIIGIFLVYNICNNQDGWFYGFTVS